MFTCLAGYSLTGTGTLTCGANGVWGSPDSCIVLVCVCVHVPRAPTAQLHRRAPPPALCTSMAWQGEEEHIPRQGFYRLV